MAHGRFEETVKFNWYNLDNSRIIAIIVFNEFKLSRHRQHLLVLKNKPFGILEKVFKTAGFTQDTFIKVLSVRDWREKRF
ncbi:MAG: hypothetical protein QXV69_07170 [Sulfolobaceae archaeon]